MKVGIDIVEIERIKSIFCKNEKLKKVFTENEIRYFDKFSEKFSHIAGDFCAKEAVAKALKTGFCKDLSPKDIEVLHDEKGAPFVNTENERLNMLLQNSKIDISISHSDGLATCICIIF